MKTMHTLKGLWVICSIFITIAMQAQMRPRLVGMMSGGGGNTQYEGTLVEYLGGTDTLAKVSPLPYGRPGCATLTEARDHKMYGLTSGSPQSYINGPVDSGSVIRYDYSTHSYSFVAHLRWATGVYPQGGLMLALNGKFYGLAKYGGSNGGGTIFSYTIGDTSVTKLIDLDSNAHPTSGLIQSSNGLLYGMTTENGYATSNQYGFTKGHLGTMFSYDVATNAFKHLYNFQYSPNYYPLTSFGNFLEVGRDTLYGMSKFSSTGGFGLFRFIPAVDTGAYSMVFEFPPNTNAHGSHTTPILGKNGLLYGLTCTDGLYGAGTLFSYNLRSAAFDTLHNFGYVTGANLSIGGDGRQPWGDIYQASDGMLYGMTSENVQNYGGMDYGSIFSYNISTRVYAENIVLNGIVGDRPYYGHLTEYITGVVIRQANTSFCAGNIASFTALDTSALRTAQWQLSRDSGITYTNITGATDSTYSFRTSYGQNGYYYRIVYSNISGADTSDPVIVHISPPVTHTLSVTTCQGQSYIWRGTAYSTPGVYTDTLANASVHGCDSVTIMQLSNYNPATYVVNVALCPGSSGYGIQGHSYTVTGTYIDTLVGEAIHGCDSIVTLHLSYYSPATRTITASICPGQSYRIGYYTHTTSGTYLDTLRRWSMNDCDSIVTLHLSVGAATSTVNAVVCVGQPYTIGTNSYLLPGTYIDTMRGASGAGCDSIVTLNLNNYPPAVNTISATICEGQSYTIGSQTFASAGVYGDTALSVAMHGCDSIIRLHLSVMTKDTLSQTVTVSLGQSVIVGADTIRTAGTYIDTLNNSAGCDSIVTTIVTIIDGIAESGSFRFALYPNPTSGMFSIEHNYPGRCNLEVMDMAGSKLKGFGITAKIGLFNISDLAAGMYQVVISSGGQILQTVKLVKE